MESRLLRAYLLSLCRYSIISGSSRVGMPKVLSHFTIDFMQVRPRAMSLLRLLQCASRTNVILVARLVWKRHNRVRNPNKQRY